MGCRSRFRAKLKVRASSRKRGPNCLSHLCPKLLLLFAAGREPTAKSGPDFFDSPGAPSNNREWLFEMFASTSGKLMCRMYRPVQPTRICDPSNQVGNVPPRKTDQQTNKQTSKQTNKATDRQTVSQSVSQSIR